MAIEGPLRELGIHDVFQLLDLSRKTGTLLVTSELRDNDGTVLFEKGRIISAAIRSNPHRIGDLLVRSGRLTPEDMARAQLAQGRVRLRNEQARVPVLPGVRGNAVRGGRHGGQRECDRAHASPPRDEVDCTRWER